MTFSPTTSRNAASDGAKLLREVPTAGTHRNRRPPIPRKGQLDKATLVVRPIPGATTSSAPPGASGSSRVVNSGFWLDTDYECPTAKSEVGTFVPDTSPYVYMIPIVLRNP
jgi:hypothetical protein